ncbi:family 43 glycosylhydrolase [soil metagenome]
MLPVSPLRLLALVSLSAVLAASPAVSQTGSSATKTQGAIAPKPLFRDPIHDGAADPTLIYNRARHEWWMFYTNRRADLALPDPKDVSWLHQTRIGIAVSRDRGAHWTYRGTAAIPYGTPDYTHWAPDIVFDRGTYHMFLTVVPGTFTTWNAAREIVHLTSPDLLKWNVVSKLDLGSDRVIDPSLYHLPSGNWRMWYKDERDHSHIHFADSPDLKTWTPVGVSIADRSSEAPKVFFWHDQYWLIVDAWKGLGVYHSPDAEHWVRQPDNILESPGHIATDRSIGHHEDVVLHDGRAFIFYFTHQDGADLDPKLPQSSQRPFLQAAELQFVDGKLTVDRDIPAHIDLGP